MSSVGGRGFGRGRARGRVLVDPTEIVTEDAAGPSRAIDVTAGVADVSIDCGASEASGGLETARSSIPEPPSERNNESVSVSTVGSGEKQKGLRVTIREDFCKMGKGGTEQRVITNYLHMNKTADFHLYQYRVDFQPEEDVTEVKKILMREKEEELGAFIFDGHMLYAPRPIGLEKRELTAGGGGSFKVVIKSVGMVLPDSPMFVQFYNMVMRKCMQLIGMEEVGRNFYDRTRAITFPEDRLELWPGIITAIRRHEVGMLMCVEVIHKVLRKESVYEMIEKMRTIRRNQRDFEEAVKKELIGVIVITHYNRKTYRIDDVDFNINPGMTFSTQDGTMKKYTEYYYERHGIEIKPEHMNQPALVSHPRKRDINKGQTTDIHLFPSLCHPTGLTDEMRKNFGLMKRLSDHLHMGPSQRYESLKQFVAKLRNTQAVNDELTKWNVDFDLTDDSFVTGFARELPFEQIYFGPEGSRPVAGDVKADWTRQLKERKMLEIAEFQEWIIFCPDRDATCVPNLVLELKRQASMLGMAISDPLTTIPYPGGRSPALQIRNELKRRPIIKFAFIILTNNNVSTYAEVKKMCVLEFGIGCQCFLAKNMNKVDAKAKTKMGSICSKVMIQINAKLGGVPWGIKIPVEGMMVLGFDVYHCSERKGQSVGALVSTCDNALNKYHSLVNFHKDGSELAKNLTAGMLKSLEAYRNENKGALPCRVMLFRDGVGEGQINFVLDHELPQLRQAIDMMYKDNEQEKPLLSVLIVTKKINTRMLLARKLGSRRDVGNVVPGTVLDNTVTLPERYDFFLVSQSVNQGTVSPSNFNVVYDESDWQPERMQRMSFKLCHLYYNWCGTVAVPAPCQYAHKLAYLTGIALNDEAPRNLNTKLWYL